MQSPFAALLDALRQRRTQVGTLPDDATVSLGRLEERPPVRPRLRRRVVTVANMRVVAESLRRLERLVTASAVCLAPSIRLVAVLAMRAPRTAAAQQQDPLACALCVVADDAYAVDERDALVVQTNEIYNAYVREVHRFSDRTGGAPCRNGPRFRFQAQMNAVMSAPSGSLSAGYERWRIAVQDPRNTLRGRGQHDAFARARATTASGRPRRRSDSRISCGRSPSVRRSRSGYAGDALRDVPEGFAALGRDGLRAREPPPASVDAWRPALWSGLDSPSCPVTQVPAYLSECAQRISDAVRPDASISDSREPKARRIELVPSGAL